MKYQFNGKTINIPDDEIKRSMKAYKLTKEDAIQMYLDDNEITINEEQQELVKKTKGQKVQMDKKPKAKRSRTVKIDETKVNIINLIEKTLKENGYKNVNIENNQKLVTFTVNDEHFTLNLTKQRKKKD